MSGEIIRLPQPGAGASGSFEAVLARRRTKRSFQPRALTIGQLSRLLWAAQGVTDDQNGYRTTPSGGAVYPLRLYVVVGEGAVGEVAAGLYRHEVTSHVLSLVVTGDLRASVEGSMFNHGWVAEAPANFIIVSRYGPMLEKFGRLGTRYTDMEAGHMAQNICLQAVSLGLSTGLVVAFDGSRLATLLQLSAGEEAVYSLPVGYAK